jgi:hypothetical protein
MINFRTISALVLLTPFSATPQITVNSRPAVALESKTAKLVVDLAGGSISDFRLSDLAVNPLTWDSKGKDPEPRPMGHFLCLDRWGAPSAAEEKNGMPFHGEASRVMWQVLKAGKSEVEMTASLPIAGLDVARRLRLSPDAALFTVVERVTNRNKLGRVYNIVQHPSIAPPFLDEKTLVDANAKRGFMQNSPMPNPEQPSVDWPRALSKGKPVDLRRLTNDSDPNVVSYVIDDEYGWTTASSPSAGLLLGYIWKTTDYPWLDIWRHTENGKSAARGLEFGTTGLHQPFPVLVKKGRIFDRPLYVFLDAGATEARSYACFLMRIPRDYRGVAELTYTGGRFRLREHGGAGRELMVQVGDLFAER